MILIWFNPDMDAFQSGTIEEYDLLSTFSYLPEKFELVAEFTNTSNHVIDEMVYALNSMREEKCVPVLA